MEDARAVPNVKEHALPLAGASDETVVRVHITGDVDDKAASGGCCVSTHKIAFSRRKAITIVP